MGKFSADSVRSLRLDSLLLAEHDATTPEDVVGWFGAMQGQDLASVKWSVALRLPQTAEIDVDGALERGTILRTWPMRGTIHLIPSSNARWMLETTGSRQLNGVEKRWDRLDLDRRTVERAGDVLADGLKGNRRLTRAQCSELLNANGVDTSGQRLYHLLWHSSQVGITCIGPSAGKEQTFVLLDEFAPNQRALAGSEALTELAWLFVRSHGPVPATDLAGWAGIPLTVARKALAENDGRITKVATELGDLWMSATQLAGVHDRGSGRDVLALPGFDEFMLGYKDRGALLKPDHMQHVVPGNNGVFRPTIVDRGVVIGTWKRNLTQSKVRVQAEPFGKFTGRQRSGFARSIALYGRYLGRTPELTQA